jgi:hypothetical protein
VQENIIVEPFGVLDSQTDALKTALKRIEERLAQASLLKAAARGAALQRR